MDRRIFIGGLAAALAGCTTSPSVTTPATERRPTTTVGRTTTTPPAAERPLVEKLDPPAGEFTDEVFALGVASGDPDATSVVLWTRLMATAETFLPDAARLLWEVAYEEDFTELAATGVTDVGSGFAHAAHVIVTGLPPGTSFYYRFRVGAAVSPVGRTKTMAAPGTMPTRLRLGISSCQLMETGYWAAHRDLAAADVDLVLWLGDFIYGGAGFSQYEGRAHRGNDPVGLGAYRSRYAQYREDPVLQACSAAHPWMVTWDDHEVVNDYDASVDPIRRAAAYQAWWEHQPTRVPAPGSTGFDIYRSVDAGQLCRITVLDTRQYSDSSTLLGADQQAWLEQELAHDRVWTVLASPVLVSGVLIPLDDEVLLPYTWDGHPTERAWLADQLAGHPNRICVSGDLHASSALTVRADPSIRSLPVVGTEFMAPAISSQFPQDVADLAPFLTLSNPHMEHFETANGWLLLDISTEQTTAEFRFVDDITDPDSAITSSLRYEVRAGDPNPRRL